MSVNMSYCRFRNTLEALRECYEDIDREDLSEDETKARARLVKLCTEIAGDYEDSFPIPAPRSEAE